jgi:hypothetical protein
MLGNIPNAIPGILRIGSKNKDPPRGRSGKAKEQTENGRLASPVGAHEGSELTLVYMEGCIGEDSQAAVGI